MDCSIKLQVSLLLRGHQKHYLIVENQLKPILGYMKVTFRLFTYVFIEEQDFQRKELVNDDVIFRIDRLM